MGFISDKFPENKGAKSGAKL